MIGEMVGYAEEGAAAWIKDHCTKPVAALSPGLQHLQDVAWAMREPLCPADKAQRRQI